MTKPVGSVWRRKPRTINGAPGTAQTLVRTGRRMIVRDHSESGENVLQSQGGRYINYVSDDELGECYDRA